MLCNHSVLAASSVAFPFSADISWHISVRFLSKCRERRWQLRAICFLLVELPKPERIIWRSPGFPDTENDYFFSGHVGLPIIAAMELWELGFKRTALMFHFVNFIQVFLFISLQVNSQAMLRLLVSLSRPFF